MEHLAKMFSAARMEEEANRIALETVLKECHRDDYHEEYYHDGFYLMFTIDGDLKGETRKYIWKIIGPNGVRYDLPELTFRQKSFSYEKVPFEVFQQMTKIIRIGAKL